MAKRKPKPEESQPVPATAKRPNRTGLPLHIYLPKQLREAFDTYIESLKPKPSATSAAAVAIEEFLEKRGFWPPPGAEA